MGNLIARTYKGLEEREHAIMAALRKRPEARVDFMVRIGLGLEKPDARRAPISCAVQALCRVLRA